MKYTLKDLRVDFPDEDACLEWLLNMRYPEGVPCKKCQKVTKHSRVKGRRCYACTKCNTQVYPTAGTIYHNSHIPLLDWFYAVYLMSTNKAGVPAAQIERELGCTYQTAWRMMHQIRKMMTAPQGLFSGEVEIDESFVKPNVFKRSSARKRYGFDARRKGEVLFGIVERGGAVKIWHVKTAGARVIQPLIRQHVKYGTMIHTDGYLAYRKLPKMGYRHRWTDHGSHEYWREDSYTQNIENVWSTMKPRWKGTFKHVSPQHLQAYADEFAWRYSYRNATSMFWLLMCRVSEPTD